MNRERKIAECSALERRAYQAYLDGDHQQAARHTIAAAEACFDLAEIAHDPDYAVDGTDLLAIADQLATLLQTPEKQTATRAEEAAIQPMAELPRLTLTDVAGLDDVKAAFHEKVIRPLRHPEIYQRFRAELGGGVLLYGPPGTGKTFIAQALAGELGVPFFCPEISTIKSKYVGETAKNMASLFEQARKHPLAVIFMDEVDSLLANRGHRHADAVAQFLTLADGLQHDNRRVLLVAATNRPFALDSAVLRPGRLGTHIYVGLPDVVARQQMLNVMLHGVPCDEGLELADLAASTEGRSGAEIKEIVARAKGKAIERQLATNSAQMLCADDFAHALAQVPAGTDPDELQKFHEWRTKRHSTSAQNGDDE